MLHAWMDSDDLRTPQIEALENLASRLLSQLAWDIVSTSPIEYAARGFAYMHQLPLFAARKPDMSDLLLPDQEKDVAVDITCTSGTVAGNTANAESAIVLSRLVR